MTEPGISDFPPVITELSESQRKRFEQLHSSFRQKYGSDPEFYVRAPGRVNLIGEHIDYCGYAVFPMAIEQDILIACQSNPTAHLNLTNVNGKRYVDYTTPIEVLKIDDSEPKWFHYFLCGMKGISEEFNLSSLVGLDVTVHGIVPPSAGLSSSSALVCASALATLHANKLKMTKTKLASLCAKSERYIGTQGGGMDQAIAFLAEAGTAKLIEFNPLSTTSVCLPPGSTFVVANSCVEMNKAATSHFNIRVIECRLSAQLIAKSEGLDWQKFFRLGDVQAFLGIPLHEIPNLVEKVLHKETYTRKELCNILELEEQEFEDRILSKNTKHLQEFKLYQRALHVFKEADRVWQFKSICESGSSDALEKLGQLMNESHASCRDLYECSHPDLDELVNTALTAGALGARLTGAGWGGCVIALIPSGKVETFLNEVKEKFYNKTNLRSNQEQAIFITQPGSGAAVFSL